MIINLYKLKYLMEFIQSILSLIFNIGIVALILTLAILALIYWIQNSLIYLPGLNVLLI